MTNNIPTLRVSTIQRFCLHDGPGIRTTVFLQGCSLSCWWCHNAELQPRRSDDVHEAGIDKLVEELERDARYWVRSGGGITLSGGEPLFQPELGAALLSKMQRHGYHCCVETAGAVPASAVALLNKHVDLWLFDLKTLNAQTFHEATGGDLSQVLSNLQELINLRAETVWVRIPIIKGFNDDIQNLDEMRQFLEEHQDIARVQLLPGHDFGTSHRRCSSVEPVTCDRALEILKPGHNHVEVCW